MTYHLICFADHRFRSSQERLLRSAARSGIDKFHAFGPEDVRKRDFYAKHRNIFDQRRGAGYWLWKPYFIQEILRQASPGDCVLYVDSGVEIVSPVQVLGEVCKDEGGILLFANHGRLNRYWTKRDCYVLMNCDNEAYYNAEQVNAAFSVYIAGTAAEAFVDEWLTHCTDPRKLTDIPNECGLPDLPYQVTHLHDQSIVSLLARQRGLFLHRDPSQSGNHMKPPALRIPGEHRDLPYSIAPCERSPYPTLFNHHRNLQTEPSRFARLIGGAKATFRHFVPKQWPNPYFKPADLAAAVQRNRKTLAGVAHWFDPEVDARSLSGYGVPAGSRQLLDRPVGSPPTVADLICHMAEHLGHRLSYLETGVSVGKNFYQLLRAGERRKLTGFEIEEVHPNLASRLTRGTREEWASLPGSSKPTPSSLTSFSDPVGGNCVRYLAGDFFDEECWIKLEGSRFNFVFSDARKKPEAPMFEWQMIRKHGLLDLSEFVMVWDDLGGYMTFAFDRIADQVMALAGPCLKLMFPLRGWLGVNEYVHQVGVLAKLRNPPVWMARIPMPKAPMP